MKRIAVAVVSLALLLAPTSALAQAVSETTVLKIEVFTVPPETFVPCANNGQGEFIILEGTLNAVFHVTITDTGRIVFVEKFNPQGVTGTGVETGDVYRGTGNTITVTGSGQGVPFTTTTVNSFKIIGPSGNSLRIQETIHLTILESGEVTADVSQTKVTCR
jgi:hypothetical protein